MIQVSPVSDETIDAAAEVLGQAFANDPFFALLVPQDVPDREERIIRAYQSLAHLAEPSSVDVATIDGQVVGAALWSKQPRNHVASDAKVWKKRLDEALGEEGAKSLQAFSEATHPYAPVGPHWYLEDIGASPAARGLGVGKALLKHRLDIADQEHLPAFLESTTPNSQRLYARFGFEKEALVTMQGTDLTVMIRPAH